MFDEIKELKLKIAHIGINSENEAASMGISEDFAGLLNLPVKVGNSSVFVGNILEIMKKPFLGTNGHIALETENLDNAIRVLQAHGYEFDPDTLKSDKEGVKKAIYLKKEIGGFAIHLLKA